MGWDYVISRGPFPPQLFSGSVVQYIFFQAQTFGTSRPLPILRLRTVDAVKVLLTLRPFTDAQCFLDCSLTAYDAIKWAGKIHLMATRVFLSLIHYLVFISY